MMLDVATKHWGIMVERVEMWVGKQSNLASKISEIVFFRLRTRKTLDIVAIATMER